MRRNTAFLGLAAALLFAPALLRLDAAQAQRAHSVTIQLREAPVVGITYDGTYGPIRVTGTLTRAPQGNVRLRASDGRTRDISWAQLAQMEQHVSYGIDGITVEKGPLTATLRGVGDNRPGGLPGGVAVGGFGGGGLAVPTWTVVGLPNSELEIRGEPYGTLKVPAQKLTGYAVTPVEGTVTLPDINLELEIERGKTVTIPLGDVQVFERLERNVASVQVGGQTFTGKLLRVPDVNLEIQTNGTSKRLRIPLSQIQTMTASVYGVELR